ncbi:hypothetical protein ANOBCDAF_01342 [Pleomorphomonas sp. T1.2MG-36]|uniref:hypothetical protein n=1 Tax=Pleomorphomonas sp. T1.2MG-36 TaxID=3041167 RepID=UPI002477CBBD|nr:hypothetical protein [Pleomorphomonas sp. T1.2MG-36]CAI9405950.1 hypothetical protein ANOBCDAF_01342 [Pleomorphomonas sp. T1.2MG-36]
MSISSVSYRPTPALGAPRPSEAAEASGPDHDGDADDVGAVAPAKSSLATGIGQLLDMLA